MNDVLPHLAPAEATSRTPVWWRQWWVTFVATTAMVVCGHLLIKAGLNAAATPIVARSFVPRLLIYMSQPRVLEGLLIYALGSLCWMATVAQKDVSFLYPLTSVNYVLIVGASAVFFQEAITLKRGAGVGLIVAGVVLMSRRERRTSS